MERKRRGYWNKENCTQEAFKYKIRSDFFKNSNGAYCSALKNKWLDEICEHMLIIGNNRKRCIYAVEFSDNHVYIGLTYYIEKRFKDHTNNVDYNESSVLEYINKTGLIPVIKQLTEYIDVKDASKLEGIKKDDYKNNGWIILNKTKCGSIGGNAIKWSKEKCAEAALKYKTRGEFKKELGWAYTSSLSNGWLDEICSHMEYMCRPNNYWNKEKCLKEALKFKTRRDFNIKSKGAYNASSKHGWLDEICNHMNTLKNGTWQIKENCLKEALKYNSKTEFRKNCGGAYMASLRNNWLDEITQHMKIKIKHENK
jgi:predicted GIY-YIG superfamily endonuclease